MLAFRRRTWAQDFYYPACKEVGRGERDSIFGELLEVGLVSRGEFRGCLNFSIRFGFGPRLAGFRNLGFGVQWILTAAAGVWE